MGASSAFSSFTLKEKMELMSPYSSALSKKRLNSVATLKVSVACAVGFLMDNLSIFVLLFFCFLLTIPFLLMLIVLMIIPYIFGVITSVSARLWMDRQLVPDVISLAAPNSV